MPPLSFRPLFLLTALALVLLCRAAAAQGIAADIPLASGSQRVLFAGPANPRAILIMLPGGDGITEIGQNGAIGRGGGNFLVRTLPLWLAQGFAVEILGAPNNASLMGQRHTPVIRRRSTEQSISPAPGRMRRSGWSAPARARPQPPMARRISAASWPGWC